MSPRKPLKTQRSPLSVRGVELSEHDSNSTRQQKLAKIILDAMYQFLGLLDVDGTVIEINQTALDGAGVSLAEVVGKPFWEARWWALSDSTRERVKSMVAQARQGEFVRCDIEVYGEAQGTQTIIVDFSLTPIRDDSGEVAFLLPEGRNISEKMAIEAELTRKNNELQAALEKLKELDGFKTRFFANVSHELRTPLALILGPIDQLLRDAGNFSERDRLRLGTVKRNAQSLLRQVNDLLDLARIDADQMPLAYVCTDLTALVKEVLSGFAEVAEERGVSLQLEGESELYADVDTSKLVRVVTNLLSNAFKFTPPGGRIRCSLELLPNRRFLLSVQDNGPGVPLRLRRQIFDRFAQGQAEQSSAGSGLGLSIVKEFVELHNGSVAVIDAPETGAIFQIEIPVRAPDGAFFRARSREDYAFIHPAADLLRPVAVRVVKKNSHTPHLLVVEDNPDLRQFLCDVLVDDYRVSLAENGAEALQLALTDPPDLVITDLMMPESDGEDFIRKFRANPKGKQVPVLVLSARADDVLRESLLTELVQDYVTKPFSPQELMARVKNLVTVKTMVNLLQEELNSQASDISELTRELVASRKSLQEGLVALQMSERRWLGLYENTAVGIALIASDGRIVKANPALQEMLGYNEEEIAEVSLIDITEESERFVTRQNVLGLIGGVIQSYHVQKRYERRDGEYLWANVSASLIPAIDAEPPLIAVIVEDITSRKEAEDLLAATQSDLARVSRYTAMGELVATIAHEVNQPLSAIVTNSQAALRWLERAQPNYEEVVAALQRVNRDAVLAGNVITRTRNFLKKGGIHPERVRVAPIIDSLLQILSRRLQTACVRVKVKIAANLPAFSADPVQLQQVLMNLVVNAIDVLRDQAEGLIYVEVDEAPGKGVLFSVRDTGPGIPPDKRAKIFEPFFSTKSDGLGMGLAISRSIIENHGGELWLDGDCQPGACFEFWLPSNPS